MKRRKTKHKNLIIYFGFAILCMLFIIVVALYYPLISLFLSTILFIMFFILLFRSKRKAFSIINIILVCICITFSSYQLTKEKVIETYIGIDVSKWNGDINIEEGEYDFAIIRVGYTSTTDGITIKNDEKFHNFVQQCIDEGIPYGVYYYSLASTPQQAKKEADFVLEEIKGYNPTLGVYIDMEDKLYQEHLPVETLTSCALTFVEEIEKNGYQAGVYANKYWWDNKLDTEQLDKYYMWIAIYSDTYTLQQPYDIHQYTNTGKVPSIDGDVDLNIVHEKFW